MLGKIFGAFCVIACLTSLFTGNTAALGDAVFSGADSAVKLIFSLVGMMCLWCGILRVLEEAGVTEKLAKLLSPLMRIMFPDAYRNQKGIREISASISANLLGIGNAATPLGIRAMEELNRENPVPGTATDDMTTFVVLNTASFSILPTTLLTMRRAAGSANPFAIMPAVWLCSLCGAILAVLLARTLRFFYPAGRTAAKVAAPASRSGKRNNV